jgi:hypothetical protein
VNVAEFVEKWQRVELTERSAAQQHFLDLCEVFEHPKPAAVDPTGESFTFEKGASKEGGGEGWADVCRADCELVEELRRFARGMYDPCCGSSGMSVQSVEFIRAHAKGKGNGGKARADISIHGQESNYTTWRLAKVNLAIRGIDGQIADGDTFHDDQHPTSGRTSSSPSPRSTSPTGAARACATTGAGCSAFRRPATPTSPGCSTTPIIWRRTASRGSCRPTARCRPTSQARARSARA